MKYISKLTEDEIFEIFKLCSGDSVIKELKVVKGEYSIDLYGRIYIEDSENPDETIEIQDDYELTDFNVRVYDHSGNPTYDYRKWMYNKFGEEYAKDYLLGIESEEEF